MHPRKITPESDSAILAGFQSRAHARISFDISQTIIDDAYGYFDEFLTLPQDVKDTLTFKHTPQRRGCRVGYTPQKDSSRGPIDPKELVHYHGTAETCFIPERRRYPSFDRLLRALRPIHEIGLQRMYDVLQVFERYKPGITPQYFPRDNRHPFSHVRIIQYWYDPQTGGPILARGHYDIGSWTLAIDEDKPGLQIGGDEGTPMYDIERHPGTAVLMAGWNLPAELPDCGIMPAWHQVLRIPEASSKRMVARKAIVMFNDDIDAMACDISTSHTRRGSQLSLPQISQQQSA